MPGTSAIRNRPSRLSLAVTSSMHHRMVLDDTASSSASSQIEMIPEHQRVLFKSQNAQDSADPKLIESLDLSPSKADGGKRLSRSGANSRATAYLQLKQVNENLCQSPPPPSALENLGLDDMFHLELNQCDPKSLSQLRRIRESNPIVITECEDDDDRIRGILDDFSGASVLWGARSRDHARYIRHHYHPTSALMRSAFTVS